MLEGVCVRVRVSVRVSVSVSVSLSVGVSVSVGVRVNVSVSVDVKKSNRNPAMPRGKRPVQERLHLPRQSLGGGCQKSIHPQGSGLQK